MQYKFKEDDGMENSSLNTPNQNIIFSETIELIENVENSDSKNEILKKIASNISKQEGRDLTDMVNQTNFINILINICQTDKSAAIQALQCIKALMNISSALIRLLFENNILALLEFLLTSDDTKISGFSAKCMKKLLKLLNNEGITLAIDQNMIDSLSHFGQISKDEFNGIYVKLLYEIVSHYDILDFAYEFITQILILLEHRSSSVVNYYSLLIIKEIITKYPQFQDEIFSFPIIGISLETDLFSTNFDINAVLNTIKFYIEFQNPMITDQIKENLKKSDLVALLNGNDETIIESDIDLLYCAISYQIIPEDFIQNSELIPSLINVLENSSLRCKESATHLLLLQKVSNFLNSDQLLEIFSSGVDMLPNMESTRSEFLFMIYKTISSQDRQLVSKLKGILDEYDFFDMIDDLDLSEQDQIYINEINKSFESES